MIKNLLHIMHKLSNAIMELFPPKVARKSAALGDPARGNKTKKKNPSGAEFSYIAINITIKHIPCTMSLPIHSFYYKGLDSEVLLVCILVTVSRNHNTWLLTPQIRSGQKKWHQSLCWGKCKSFLPAQVLPPRARATGSADAQVGFRP